MKWWLAFLLALPANQIGAAPRSVDSLVTTNYFPLWQKGKTNLVDLVLIYQGGLQRPHWTTERFAPYVTFRNSTSAREHWLFDAFLFIEFQDGRGHGFEAGVGKTRSQKTNWQWLLDRNFAPDDGIPLLEKACQDACSRIGEPLRRRQVVITLPEPVPGQTNWGELNGRPLDFRLSSDRLAACEWYMTAALSKWQAMAPRQLDFAGFYWLNEAVPHDPELVRSLARWIHARGKQFYWIPYWQPKSWHGQWRSFGFDTAWQQPNHFFHPDVPDSRLQDACDFARLHGMGLEMEFDARMMQQRKIFGPRFDAYFDYFTRCGVRDNASIAWYEGGVAIFDLATSQDLKFRSQYARIGRFVLERQHRADADFIKFKYGLR